MPLTNKITPELLTAALLPPLIQSLQNSLNLDLGIWPIAAHEYGTANVMTLLDYNVITPLLNPFGISSVVFRFDVAFNNCMKNPDSNALQTYLWQSNEFEIWGGSCSHHFTFLDMKGEDYDHAFADELLQSLQDMAMQYLSDEVANRYDSWECYMADFLVNTALQSLSEAQLTTWLNAVYRQYWKDAKKIATLR